MEFFRRLNEETFDCSFNVQDIQRRPLLRKVNKPTSFSFFSKGPIFEFDMAFKVFHGKAGVIPLTERCQLSNDNMEAGYSVPLVAKTASISLSSFGAGGPFSFDSFSREWNSKKKKKKNKSFSQDKSSNKHAAMGNEWLETGNCPIAKSYRAVSGVLPIMASTFQMPPGMKLKCPPAVAAVRAALARTVFVKSMRPQPLHSKMFVIGALGIAANIPLGIWREHTEKFSLSWFTAVHAAVPFIAMLRKSVVMPKTAMALTIAASILGQVIGLRAERLRMKATANNNNISDNVYTNIIPTLNVERFFSIDAQLEEKQSIKGKADCVELVVQTDSDIWGYCWSQLNPDSGF